MKKILIIVMIIFLASCTNTNNETRVVLSDKLIVEALTFSDAKLGQYGDIVTIYDRKYYNYGQYGEAFTFNIEHMYRKELLESNEMKKDLYNLRFSTKSVNSQKAYLKYVDKKDGGSFGLFEDGFYPGDEDKGDVARALMYMAHTYKLDLSKMIDVKVALKWHEDDPVDEFERHRADIIKAIQGNENPFIEDSRFANKVFGNNRTILWIVLGVVVVGYIGFKSKKQ